MFRKIESTVWLVANLTEPNFRCDIGLVTLPEIRVGFKKKVFFFVEKLISVRFGLYSVYANWVNRTDRKNTFYPYSFNRTLLTVLFYPYSFTGTLLPVLFYPYSFTRTLLPVLFYPYSITRSFLPVLFY